MKWFQLIAALLPVVEETFAAIEDAINAGKSTAAIHSTVVDHVAALPAKIRE